MGAYTQRRYCTVHVHVHVGSGRLLYHSTCRSTCTLQLVRRRTRTHYPGRRPTACHGGLDRVPPHLVQEAANVSNLRARRGVRRGAELQCWRVGRVELVQPVVHDLAGTAGLRYRTRAVMSPVSAPAPAPAHAACPHAVERSNAQHTVSGIAERGRGPRPDCTPLSRQSNESASAPPWTGLTCSSRSPCETPGSTTASASTMPSTYVHHTAWACAHARRSCRRT